MTMPGFGEDDQCDDAKEKRRDPCCQGRQVGVEMWKKLEYLANIVFYCGNVPTALLRRSGCAAPVAAELPVARNAR
jgi:hypothetical protein